MRVRSVENAIVAYVHGKDAFNEDGDSNPTEMRSAVLGDIFHSNILFIGSPTTIFMHEPSFSGFYTAHKGRDRVAYAGANDAMLHAFDAGAYWDQTNPIAWNDGRLNPFRGPRTAAGDAQMERIWTNTVPRKLTAK